MRRRLAALLAFIALPASAQMDTFAGGVLADGSIVAPVVRWQRVLPSQDVIDAGINGWELSASYEKRLLRRRSRVIALAISPIHAHSSNRVYELGRRARHLEYENASAELSGGRIDRFTDRWTSDVRGVLLMEDISGVDEKTHDAWSRPYAGIRITQTYRKVTAENPLLLTTDGFTATMQVESFLGSKPWSRVTAGAGLHRRFGRWRVGPNATVFAGRSLNTVSRFLVGGSWPVPGVHALNGFRYGEFRVDRGVSASVDVERGAVGLRGSALIAPGIRAQGFAVDYTRQWRGIGLRAGAGIPFQRGRQGDGVLGYLSLFAASFR